MTSTRSISSELLSSLMNRLIPAVGDLPAAGEMGLTEEVLRLAGEHLRYSALFTSGINALIEKSDDFINLSGSDQDSVIRELESSYPVEFDAVRTLVYIVYYKDERVHARIGWDSRPPQPEGNVMEPWDESILETTKNREPFWRKA
jgi:hypothetical protein